MPRAGQRAAPIGVLIALLLAACGTRGGDAGRLDPGALADELGRARSAAAEDRETTLEEDLAARVASDPDRAARGLIDVAWTSTESLAVLVDEPALAGRDDVTRALLEIGARGETAEVRVAALRALGSLPGDARTASEVGRIARRDPDALVRETAADALAGIAERSPEQAPLVASELALALETESDGAVRAALLDAAPTLGDEPDGDD